MRVFSIVAAGCALFGGAASAAGYDRLCTRGEDVRHVAVLTPGEIGAACDMRYIRDGGANVSVPFHADNDDAFCKGKARDLVRSLTEAGFDCIETPSPAREAEAEEERRILAEMQAAFESAAGAPEEAFADTAFTEDFDSGHAPASIEEPVSVAAVDGAPVVLEQPMPALTLAETPAPQRPAEGPAEATRGPLALSHTEASAPAPVQSSAPRAAGRLVGASSDAPPPAAVSVTQAVAVAPAAATTAAMRPSREVIENVLAAQAAAWNEGDLDAFMEAYWNHPDLRFVSGTIVSKGWRNTLNRHREHYGADGARLGRLSYEGLDVSMATDDVAVVVGRFRRVHDERRDTGVFTLVMRRFDGLWRIVHDHSVRDPTLTD